MLKGVLGSVFDELEESDVGSGDPGESDSDFDKWSPLLRSARSRRSGHATTQEGAGAGGIGPATTRRAGVSRGVGPPVLSAAPGAGRGLGAPRARALRGAAAPPPSDAPGRPAGAEVGPGTVGDLDVADLKALDPTARAERAIAHAAQKVCGGRTV